MFFIIITKCDPDVICDHPAKFFEFFPNPGLAPEYFGAPPQISGSNFCVQKSIFSHLIFFSRPRIACKWFLSQVFWHAFVEMRRQSLVFDQMIGLFSFKEREIRRTKAKEKNNSRKFFDSYSFLARFSCFCLADTSRMTEKEKCTQTHKHGTDRSKPLGPARKQFYRLFVWPIGPGRAWNKAFISAVFVWFF